MNVKYKELFTNDVPPPLKKTCLLNSPKNTKLRELEGEIFDFSWVALFFENRFLWNFTRKLRNLRFFHAKTKGLFTKDVFRGGGIKNFVVCMGRVKKKEDKPYKTNGGVVRPLHTNVARPPL
jgi:hypothetical protein